MTASIQRLSPETRDALLRATELFSEPGGAALNTSFASALPVSRRLQETTSRQGRHARLVRARGLGVAAVWVLAADHPQFADALLAPDFGTLRPLSADVQRRAWYILSHHTRITAEGAGQLFERSAGLLFDLGLRLDSCSRNEVLRLQGALTGILLGCLALPQAFATRWQDLFSQAQRLGLLENRHVHLQLALAGSYVGHHQAHLECLLDAQVRGCAVAGTYLFVRRDDSEELLETTARSIRGEELTPQEVLLPSNPASTVKLLAGYARTCMRDPAHFSNESQVLMVLQWIEEVWTRMRALVGEGLPQEEVDKVKEELRKVERVQSIEKARFWRTVENADPCVRAELQRLWSRSLEDDA